MGYVPSYRDGGNSGSGAVETARNRLRPPGFPAREVRRTDRSPEDESPEREMASARSFSGFLASGMAPLPPDPPTGRFAKSHPISRKRASQNRSRGRFDGVHSTCCRERTLDRWLGKPIRETEVGNRLPRSSDRAGGSRRRRNAPSFGVVRTNSTDLSGVVSTETMVTSRGGSAPRSGFAPRQGWCPIRFERTDDGAAPRRPSGLRVRVFGSGTVE